MSVRSVLRQAAYQSGVLQALRSRRHGEVLTIVMFHRVIDRADPDFAEADRTYTVSTALFEALVTFFQDHYSVVSLEDVLNASHGRRPLPKFPLLITFDDGWRDNLLYAAPILARRGLPSVVFAAAEPITSPANVWWQEAVFSAARSGTLAIALSRAQEKSAAKWPALKDGCVDTLDFVCHLAAMTQSDRDLFLSSLDGTASMRRMMLTADDLPALQKSGIAVGVHGFSHLPLTRVGDVASELERAKKAITSLTGEREATKALACPHGLYDARVLESARAAGYELVFSSDPVLNLARGGFVDARHPLGRINMIEGHLVDRSGRPDPAAMATWLWHRTCA